MESLHRTLKIEFKNKKYISLVAILSARNISFYENNLPWTFVNWETRRISHYQLPDKCDISNESTPKGSLAEPLALTKFMLNIAEEMTIEISYSMDHGLLKSSGPFGLEFVIIYSLRFKIPWLFFFFFYKVQHPLIEW